MTYRLLGFIDNVSVIHPTGVYAVLGHVQVVRDNQSEPLPLTLKWHVENMAMREADVELRIGESVEV